MSKALAGLIPVTLLFTCAATLLAAQQDAGPVYLPHNRTNTARQTARPAGATLRVSCDMTCRWSLDGVARGTIASDGSATATVSRGQHLLIAATLDRLDSVKKEIDVTTTGQIVTLFELRPVRAERLKENQSGQENAAQQAATQRRQEQAEAVRRQQEELARQQREAASRQPSNAPASANDQYRQGRLLVGQNRYSEAWPYLERACNGGELAGCVSLGYIWEEGNLGVKDYAVARRLYQRACEGNEANGCLRLGLLYQNGYGVAPDRGAARRYFQRACAQANSLACNYAREP